MEVLRLLPKVFALVRGRCLPLQTPKTTDGSGLGIFNSNITGLDEYTTYYVRGYAINSEGTNYGTQVSFKTLPAPVYDIEGNKYNALAKEIKSGYRRT
jgi:hypothetical protein